jgi:hypothetical protein
MSHASHIVLHKSHVTRRQDRNESWQHGDFATETSDAAQQQLQIRLQVTVFKLGFFGMFAEHHDRTVSDTLISSSFHPCPVTPGTSYTSSSPSAPSHFTVHGQISCHYCQAGIGLDVSCPGIDTAYAEADSCWKPLHCK